MSMDARDACHGPVVTCARMRADARARTVERPDPGPTVAAGLAGSCRTVAAMAAAAVVATLVFMVPSGALASGLNLPTVGTSGSNEAHADAASVHYNPAQLAWMQQREILLTVGAALGRVAYTRERRAAYQYADSFDFALPIDADDIDATRTGREPTVVDRPFAGTGDLFVAAPMQRAPITLGLGVYAPVAAILSLPPTGAQRFQVQDATILALYVTPAIGVRVSDRLALGANVSYVIGFAELGRVQDFAVLPDVGDALRGEPIGQANDFGHDAPPAVRELDVMARPTRLRRMFSHGVTASAGLSWRATDRLSLSGAYRHGVAMRFQGVAEIDMNHPFFTQDLASQGLEYDPLVEGDGTLRFRLPSTVAFGSTVTFGSSVAVDLVVAWVRWSSVDTFDVEVRSAQLAQPEVGLPPSSTFALAREWRDAAEVEATVRADLGPRWQVWGMLGWHTAAPPDETLDLASIDGQRVVLGAGAEVALSSRWGLGADATVHQMLPRDVQTSRYDVGNGEYALRLMMLGGHVAMRW